MPRTASRKPTPSPPRSQASTASGSTPPAPSLISADARSDSSVLARFETILTAQTVSQRADDWKHGMETLRCHGEPITDVATTLDGMRMVPPPGGEGSLLAVPLGDATHGRIAIRFTDGSGMFLPVLRDYRCDVVRERGRTISLSYSWLGEHDVRLEELRAEVLSAATLGFLSLKPAAIAAFADRIRRPKKYDPVLGLVAILSYTIIGDTAQARSVRNYMRDDNQAELFDTWLLGGGAADTGMTRSDRPIVPPVPLLSQTWSYLDAFGSPIGQDLKSLSRVPGFWTVFDDAAMRTVMEMAGEPKREALLYGED